MTAMRMPIVITKMPFEELWDAEGFFGERIGRLDVEDIKLMLRDGVQRFVHLNVGHPIEWIEPGERFKYWKWAKPNLTDANYFSLDDFPGGYALVAEEWRGRDDERLIVVSVFH